MLIDFAAVERNELKLIELGARLTLDDLRAATRFSIDRMLELIADLSDAAVTFDPVDPDAHDPYAVAGEETIGWSLAHLIAHVTASSEEWAAYSAILARGIPYPSEPRLRYETPWRAITTQAQCVQRLQESRRMRLAYLDAWPDAPHLETRRQMSERFTERFGEFNAPAAFLFGLWHEVNHFEQMREARRQALAVGQGI